MTLIEHALVRSGRNGLYEVEHNQQIILCRSGTKIRKDGFKLSAGDYVSVELNDDGTGFIRGIEPRTNELIRPPVANIGLLVIVVAASHPSPDPFTIDKLTVIAEKSRIPVAIAITKAELGGADILQDIYGKTPYPVFILSENGKYGSEPLLAYMQGKTTVFCGASGVGKSTLLNHLFPGLHAETGALSEKIQRGKNTTRTTSLYKFSDNTYVADTPGFTSLDTSMYCRLKKEELGFLFPEMASRIGQCRYSHCTHLCEEGCSIVDAVNDGIIAKERHASFCKLYQDLKQHPIYD